MKRSPHDTCWMLTADWPSRYRGMKDAMAVAPPSEPLPKLLVVSTATECACAFKETFEATLSSAVRPGSTISTVFNEMQCASVLNRALYQNDTAQYCFSKCGPGEKATFWATVLRPAECTESSLPFVALCHGVLLTNSAMHSARGKK